MYNKVIISTDGSEIAEKGVEEGLSLAKKLDLPVVAIHVVDLSEYEKLHHTSIKESARKEFKSAGEAVIEDVRNKAHEKGIKISTKLLYGKPSKRIIEQAGKNDIIVMSSHGFSGFSRWFLGSTTQRVLNNASCTVAVVKGE